MKLVLVSTPELIIPCGPTGNSMISLIASPAGTPISGAVVPTVDTTMFVDGFPVCTKITIELAYYPSGSTTASYENIAINGTSLFSTINNTPIILMGDSGVGSTSGIQAKVISCGQTSTSVD